MLLTKKDNSGKTDQLRGGHGEEGVVAAQGHSECTVPVPLVVWRTKKTSAMTKLHEASSEHAVWEEEEGEEEERRRLSALPALRFKPELLSLLTFS